MVGSISGISNVELSMAVPIFSNYQADLAGKSVPEYSMNLPEKHVEKHERPREPEMLACERL